VAARTRQLNHRLKGRKQAILDRRATASPTPPVRPTSPSNVALMNGGLPSHQSIPQPQPQPQSQSLPQPHSQPQSKPHPTQTSPGGFVSVNARSHHESNGNGASSTTRHELLAKFHTLSERRPSSQPSNGSTEARRQSVSAHGLTHPSTPASNVHRAPSKPAEAAPSSSNVARPSHLNDSELHSMMNSPVPIPNTPSSLLPAASQRNSVPQEKDDGGPYKTEMVHRMETLAKGERILPPCDRCRRLHMDCLKNLTACMGCTKKHAKCAWREVREGELRGNYTHPPPGSNVHSETSDHESRASTASPAAMLSPPRHASNGGHTPQHLPHHPPQVQPEHQPEHQRPHPSTETPSHHHVHYEAPPHDARIPPQRNTPPDRPQDTNVEAQLQKAVQTGLAHPSGNPNMGGPAAGGAEHHQAMVA
jgi:hypothetical protein